MKDARLRTPQAACAESEKPDGPPAERCQIEFPRMTYTQAFGINDSGQIVGLYSDSVGRHGFLLDTAGSITTIDVPGASYTAASGINNSGQIVGGFSDSTGTHGFLATPVSPGLKTERRTQGISELPR